MLLSLPHLQTPSWYALFGGVALWGVHMGMTQGLLATMVADAAPADLRGTAYGVFNLASGLAMLIASTLAGVLWQVWGAPSTFYAGALFCVLSLMALSWKPAQGERIFDSPRPSVHGRP
jgi:MFS family permease